MCLRFARMLTVPYVRVQHDTSHLDVSNACIIISSNNATQKLSNPIATVKGSAFMLQSCICQFARKTGKAFQKGAACPQAEVGEILLRIRYNTKAYCHVRDSGHVTDRHITSHHHYRILWEPVFRGTNGVTAPESTHACRATVNETALVYGATPDSSYCCTKSTANKKDGTV